MGYDNPALAYAIIRILNEYSNRPHPISKTRFNKLIYKIYWELKDDNIDLQLPNYWFKHGDFVIEEFLPPIIRTEEIELEGEKRYNYFLSDEIKTPILEREKSEIIEKKVSEVMKDWGDAKIDNLVDDHYQMAPYEFQKPYLKLKRRSERSRTKKTELSGVDNSIMHKLLCDMMSKFDHEDFKDILQLILEWKTLFSYLTRHYPNENEEIYQLMKSFIDYISSALAVITVENVPEGYDLVVFERFLENDKKFSDYLQDYKKEFYQNYYKPDAKTLKIVTEINKGMTSDL